MTSKIIHLDKTRIYEATETLVAAFRKDPITGYILSHTNSKKDEISRNLWSATLRYAQPYNHIYTTPENKGVAAWIPPSEYPLNFLQILRAGFYKIPFLLGFAGLKNFLSLFTLFDKYHAQDMHQRHWYLFALGVSEAYQGQGIGRLLIQPILKSADEEGLSCYLETSTERAVSFYQKHGFKILRTEEKPVKFWTMKREPNN
ncbi:GNAT family N-acetyltransferase [Rivularia sp. UHCC 0363]|uniref:GNAT family N-acetyltransferase n=1 Tax=Rivularia sp. UHCC 0363 TaxID=3110244 RepID=UPI002B216F19|nr:GNAT family N-acetyltransferase [Rivularia sp. UHCC 0363]MEA5597503.1 GNAT family N-acetyltransferase [Rivularia sp. UHCC 0363]